MKAFILALVGAVIINLLIVGLAYGLLRLSDRCGTTGWLLRINGVK